MSHAATMVFLARSRSGASIGRWLAQRMGGAHTVVATDAVGVRYQGGEVRVTLEQGPAVSADAAELAGRAPVAMAPLLRRARQRATVWPGSRRVDPDSIYNTLLAAFEALRDLPGAVALDPVDGSFSVGSSTVLRPCALLFPVSALGDAVPAAARARYGKRPAWFISGQHTFKTLFEREPEPEGLPDTDAVLDELATYKVGDACQQIHRIVGRQPRVLRFGFHTTATMAQARAALRASGFEVVESATPLPPGLVWPVPRKR